MDYSDQDLQVLHWRNTVLLHIVVCYLDFVRGTVAVIDSKFSPVLACPTGTTTQTNHYAYAGVQWVNKRLYSLSLHFCHASLEIVHHLLDHGVISNAVLLPITFELLVSLEISQCFQLCLKHWKCNVCRQMLPLAEASFLHHITCVYITALGAFC